MVYRPIMGGKPSSGPLKGQFAVIFRGRSGKEVSGVTLQLERDRVTADCDGYLEPETEVDFELKLTDGRVPVAGAGVVSGRHLMPTSQHWAMTVTFGQVSPEDLARVSKTVEAGIRDLADFLQEFPLFAEFTPQDTRILSETCLRHFLARNQVFFREGVKQDHLDGLYLVRRGMVRIYRQVSRLREEPIAVASAGEIFGELSLVLTQPHSASIRAVNDSELIEITREGYQVLKAEHVGVAVKLMEVMLKVLSKRLGRTTKMLFSPMQIQ